MSLQICKYLIYMSIEDLALNNLQWLIGHKTHCLTPVISFQITDLTLEPNVNIISSKEVSRKIWMKEVLRIVGLRVEDGNLHS